MAESPGHGMERLLWHVVPKGSTRRIDLVPAAMGKDVAVELDGRPLGRLPKPTPQRPWREAVFQIDGEVVIIGLTWHFPVMRTDVFVGGLSVRDGRPVDAVRADAPPPLSNYEVWLGGLYRTPFFGSRPRPPRASPILVAGSVLIWVVALAFSPFPPGLRLAAAAALLLSGVVLVVAFVWSMLAFGQRVHHGLLARPSLGDRRVALWFLAFGGYTLLGVVVVGLLLTFAAG